MTTEMVKESSGDSNAVIQDQPVDRKRFGNVQTSPIWGTIACGAGLFSDGYLNAIIGPVGTILGTIYDTKANAPFKNSKAYNNVHSIAFVGTVVGMLFFGFTSDHISRKWSLVTSTVILITFAILATASYGGGSLEGMLRALTAYRFFLGIGIGGEYPAGSVGTAEHSGSMKSGSRNRWFVMFTNVQIDLGFVVAYLVAMIVVLATTENHLRAAWRICLGLGVIPPLSLIYLRMKVSEPEPFQHEAMSFKNTPWMLVIRFYWWRLFLVSMIWFMYDFCSYSFGLYSTDIINGLLGGETKLWVTFGWGTLLNLFYMPGCILGAFLADMPMFGAKRTLVGALVLQGIVGFIMSACYKSLSAPGRIGGFVVVYGIFLALGEVGPGDNIGLFASKTSATAIRGKYYGLAAAFGKIGAFVGSYVFPEIAKAAGKDTIKGGQYQFYVGSALALFSAVLALMLPNLDQEVIAEEDVRFRAFLTEHGYDTSVMGLKLTDSSSQEVGVERDEKVKM